MTGSFAEVPDQVPTAGSGTAAGEGLAFRVDDPDRIVAGKRMEDHLRLSATSASGATSPAREAGGVAPGGSVLTWPVGLA